jgi:hypothetical protein
MSEQRIVFAFDRTMEMTRDSSSQDEDGGRHDDGIATLPSRME